MSELVQAPSRTRQHDFGNLARLLLTILVLVASIMLISGTIATSTTSRMRMEAGKRSFNALRKFWLGTADAVAKLATWASACTPASVRPEPCGNTVSPVNRPIAKANVP